MLVLVIIADALTTTLTHHSLSNQSLLYRHSSHSHFLAMSTGFGGSNSFFQAMPLSKSPGSSFGSLTDANFNVSTEDVDELLSALEASTNDQNFLKSNDDDFVKAMLGSEKVGGTQHCSLTPGEQHELDLALAGQNSLHSINGLEPFGLDEYPSDSKILAEIAEDFNFQNNSTKLDDFVDGNHTSDTKMDQHIGETNTSNRWEKTSAEMRTEPSADDQHFSSGGKRRRVPRRGSLPTMHLHYEDPYEPTPIIEHKTMFEQQQHEEEPPAKLAAVPVGESMLSNNPATGRVRAQRRGSLPTMHLNYETTDFSGANKDDGYQHTITGEDEYGYHGAQPWGDSPMKDGNEIEPSPRRVGRMPRRGSTGSFYGAPSSSSFTTNTDLGVGNVSTTVPENLDPEKMMKRLQDLMARSYNTQQKLQQWDKANGLPKSHSQTMVNTSRSRKQLLDGVILPKWDGTPLISEDVELGKPKPRVKAHKKESGGKMKRRMSAPASSGFF